MMNRRLEIGQRLRCGEVILTNHDGYSSSCAVECQLCVDRTLCSLAEFSEHIETWHTDWDDELHHEEMQEVVEELANSNDEVIQPFEKVLILTESKATLKLVYEECEETIGITNENLKSIVENPACSTKNVVDTDESQKPVTNSISTFSQTYNDDSDSYCSNDSGDCERNKYEELSKETKAKIHENNTPIDRSEDSGVEKSEVSSFTASTPQHSTSEDEAPFQPSALNVKEQIRWALNEPPPKPKLTTEHMEKLIELYEAHPRLWQQTHPEYNRPTLCRKSWKEITRTWNKLYHKSFRYRDVRIRIATLCQRYLKERRRREMSGELDESKKGIIASRFKHYDRLRFLDSCKNTPYKEHFSRLTQEHEKLLEAYRHFPILWSNRDKHHEFVELREKAYTDMCTALQLQGIHIPPKMIKQRLTCLRRRYRLEKMRHLHSKLQGKKFESIFRQYESMKFLDNFIAPFVCESCGKVSRTLADYEIHIAQKKHIEKEKSRRIHESKMINENTKSDEQQINYSQNQVSIFHQDPGLQMPENQNQYNNEINLNPIHQSSILNPIESAIQYEVPQPAAINAITENSNNILINTSPPMGISNNCTIFENAFQESSTSGLQDPLSGFNSFIEVPLILKTMEGNGDLRNYFSNPQFLELTTAFPGDLQNHSTTFQDLNTIHGNNIPPFNTVFKSPLNNMQMQTDNQISLQLLDGNVQIPSQTYVPIELIIDNGMVNVNPNQNSSNIEIVSQYINKDQLMELNNFGNSTILKPIENNFYQTDHQMNPLAISYDGTCSIFNNQNENNFFNQNEIATATIPENEITQSSMPDSSNSLSVSNEDGQVVIGESEKVDTTIKDVDDDSMELATDYVAKNDDEKEETNETDNYKTLTAKVECGDLKFELNLEKPSSSVNEEILSLNGRLPKEYALALIRSYRNFPELWHPEHINFTCRRLRRIAWRTLAKELNKELNTNYSWLKIQRKILDYIKYFRHERRRVQSKRGCTQWSLYEQFDFLDKVMTPPTDLEKRTQERELTLKIIQIYKEHPELWDTNNPHYTARHLRPRSISDLSARLQEVFNIYYEDTKLKQKIQELRKEYRSTKMAKVIAERREEIFEPLSHFEFYNDLNFLEEHIPPFNCFDCSMEFKCFTAYRVHMKQEHKANKKFQYPYSSYLHTDKNSNENICHICGMKFTLRTNLLQHLNRHYVGRSLACSICDKKFFTKYSLQEHKRTHTKEPGVICALCGRTFCNVSKLNQHMKRHRNQRDHKCEECGKLFFTAYDRDRHWRQHFKIRDKVCQVCGKSFVEGSSYYAHMKLHKEKKDYACPVCGKEFAQYAGVYKHSKRHHPFSDKKIRKRTSNSQLIVPSMCETSPNS